VNDRLQLLEEKIAYLERHVTEQDKAMLELADALAVLRRELSALRDRAGRNAGGAATGGEDDLPHERPPHY
jgi:SlyX protein